MRRAIFHGGGGVAPEPDALRGFPLGFADIEPLRLGALAPVDARGSVAGLVLAELPECLTLAHSAATVSPLCDRYRDPLRGDEKRRQDRGGLLGAIAERDGGRSAPARPRRSRRRAGQRDGTESCSMTRATVTPSARPAKLTAMRWRSTGGARAKTSSTDGLKRPPTAARRRTGAA